MSIDTQVIRAEAHAEIGLLIQHDADLLVERWCRRAIAEEPSASRVHEEVLRDQLPDSLRVMGQALAQGGNPHRQADSAVEHGEQRWDSGWSLTSLVRDYQLLQLVILEYLEESLERPLDCREAMAVGVFINDAIAASINRYVASRDEHIRRIADERSAAVDEASRRKDEFIAMLAHELRNPLAPIVNSVELLQVHLAGAGPDIRETLDIISRQSRLMTCLVDDLLDLARIAQGRIELRKEPLNLGTVLEEALQASDPVIKEREHRLTVTTAAEPLYLDADPARMTQIVVNLLNNAAKYTERGGEISVSVRREKTKPSLESAIMASAFRRRCYREYLTCSSRRKGRATIRREGWASGSRLLSGWSSFMAGRSFAAAPDWERQRVCGSSTGVSGGQNHYWRQP